MTYLFYNQKFVPFIPFTHFVHLHPSPLEITSLFSVFFGLVVLFFLEFKYMWDHIFGFLCLTYFNIMPWRSIPEKGLAPHSSTLAWRIPWTEEPGGLPSMGSLRVGHDWVTSLSLFTFMHWRRKWQAIPAFLPGESQGRGSLVGCHLWGRTESDMTEAT